MQNVLALIIVAAASAHLAWRGWSLFIARRSAGCASGCGNCPVNQSTAGKTLQLVTLDAELQKQLTVTRAS